MVDQQRPDLGLEERLAVHHGRRTHGTRGFMQPRCEQDAHDPIEPADKGDSSAGTAVWMNVLH